MGGSEGSREGGRGRRVGGREEVRDRGREGRGEGGRHKAQCQAWLCTYACQWLFNSALACWREGLVAVGR